MHMTKGWQPRRAWRDSGGLMQKCATMLAALLCAAFHLPTLEAGGIGQCAGP